MIKRKSYDDRHFFCYRQPGGKKDISELPDVPAEYWGHGYINDSRWPRLFADRLSMLMVSKTLGEEALEAFYSTNIFSFADYESFNTFIHRIDKSRAALVRKIELNATIEFDTKLALEHGIYIDTELPPDWTSYCSSSLWSLQAFAKLDNVTDIIVRLHDKMPVVHENPENWELAKQRRLLRAQVSLLCAFMEFGLLRNIKRVKVRIDCTAPRWVPERCLPAQKDYELDREALRVIENEFARCLVSWQIRI